MNVLVTGAQGYIGVHLASVLLERGHQVVGLDTGFYSDGQLYTAPLHTPPYIHKDIRHVTVRDLEGFDACVHLAELSNDPLSELNPDLTREINHKGSVRLAQLCKAARISRFVYSSSCSVYGAGSDDTKTEESPTHPQTAYARCKVLVEQEVRALGDETFSPTFLRNATAYGASPSMRFDLVLNNLAGLAWTTGVIAMVSDGTPWRPLVHVRDICEAIACSLEAPRESIHCEILNVGDDAANYRIRDIADIVAMVFEGCQVAFGGGGSDNRSYRVSFAKIHSRLSRFRSRWDAVTGARELRDLFERIGLTREVFELRTFTRVKQLKHLLAAGRLDGSFLWTDGLGSASARPRVAPEAPDAPPRGNRAQGAEVP